MPGFYQIVTSLTQGFAQQARKEEYIDYHEDEILNPEQFNVGLM